MKRIIIATYAVLLALIGHSQIPNISWQVCLGGTDLDYAYSIEQTSDGGYIVAGSSSSIDGEVMGNHGGNDFWVLKLDPNGSVQWSKCYGGSGSDLAYYAIETNDGGFIVAGYTESNDGDVSDPISLGDCWIVKLDGSGTLLWEKCYGGNGYDVGNMIQKTNDGGFVVVGESNSNDGDLSGNHGNGDSWILKMDSTGNIIWQVPRGGSLGDWGNSIAQTSDGGYIIAGGTMSNDGDVSGYHGNGDAWILKVNGFGGIMWQKSLGGTSQDWGRSVQQTSDGGYILGGQTASDDGDATGFHDGVDYLAVKLDGTGAIEWAKCFGGWDLDFGQCIRETNNHEFIMAGNCNSNSGDVTDTTLFDKAWLVLIGPQGTIQNERSFGGGGLDIPRSIQKTTDGGYCFAGHGDFPCGGPIGSHGAGDFWITKLEGNLEVQETDSEDRVTIFPNPTTSLIHIQNIHSDKFRANEFAVRDVFGRELLHSKLGVESKTIDLLELGAKGVFVIQLLDTVRSRVHYRLVILE